MVWWVLILVLSLSLKGHAYGQSVEASENATTTGVVAEEISEDISPSVTESVPTGIYDSSSPRVESSVTSGLPRSARPGRRRPRRPRGYYNDIRYRNPANNPYNPNSPYAFRGRPGQPPMAYRQQGYNNQYYDPYNQYYGYQGYPVHPQQQQYYPYPYPPHGPQPQPPTPPPTEPIPDLYYVQKADTPDGQYQYKKVSVMQDSYWENRGRRRPTRWPQVYGQPASGYYNYPYDPYNRRPPPPQHEQQYYQPYPYPQQYQSYYYPKVPGGPRSRLRNVKPPLRSTVMPISWRLTLAPATTSVTPIDPQTSSNLATEPSGG